ncbi:TBCA-domain-containing protein [Jaminaea rosea]|uniref:Tubulin-specific chaperone A n=1 Tax=Jaminaea rosea TaxID=1569628 RepID=A0A316UIC4_9BASI|nr:TBCA-domain-containing protein [Jaminaea rosea]PWN24969.1 TBCA-domain-containing protein [Jaminaea rosea]
MSDSTAIKRQLVIKTGVVKRLTKEEQTYIREAQEQRQRITNLEAQPDADEWNVKQQHKVLQDCLQMVPDCRRRLEAAVEDLKLFAEGLDEELAASLEAKAAQEALQGAEAAANEADGAEA